MVSSHEREPSTASGGRSDGTVPLRSALLTGLACASLDVAVAVLEAPYGLSRVEALYAPFAAALVLFVGVYLVSWYGLVGPISRRSALDPRAAAVATGGLVTFAFATVAIAGVEGTELAPRDLFRLAILALLAIAAAVAAYHAALRLRGVALATALVLAVPFLLFELMIFAWVMVYRSESVRSSTALFAFVSILVVASLTVAWTVRRARRGRTIGFELGALAVILSLGPAAFAVEAWTSSASRSGTNRQDVAHVVLVSVDTLRADVLEPYKSGGFETPAIRELARDGVVFEQAYSSAPWTQAALATVLTGLSPTIHSVTETKSRLPDSVTTLAEYLQREDYKTAAIVVNDLLHPESNVGQGFDEYHFLTEPSFGGAFGGELLRWMMPGRYPTPPWPSTDDVTDYALDWIREHRDESFFLWLHYYDPHAPYAPPSHHFDAAPGQGGSFDAQKDVATGFVVPGPEERKWIRDLYEAEVRYLDENLGRFTDGLKSLEVYDGSLLVLTSDHGEEFWEHGGHGHGHSQYNELLRVPLIAKLPARAHVGAVARPVSTASVTPTILALCGVDLDPQRFSSSSLRPLIEGREEEYVERPLVSTAQVFFDKRDALVFDDYKYIRSTVTGEEELYSLADDAAETRSLAGVNEPVRLRALQLLAEHEAVSQLLKERYGVGEREEIELDRETLRRLEALGYLK